MLICFLNDNISQHLWSSVLRTILCKQSFACAMERSSSLSVCVNSVCYALNSIYSASPRQSCGSLICCGRDSVQWTRESVSDGVFTALFSDGTPGWSQIEFWEISSDVFLHPVRNLKTSSSARAGGALRVPAREQRAPAIRGHLLEMSARRVQSVAAQDRDSHRTADQNQDQNQDQRVSAGQ